MLSEIRCRNEAIEVAVENDHGSAPSSALSPTGGAMNSQRKFIGSFLIRVEFAVYGTG
jgi:hypothetical protein